MSKFAYVEAFIDLATNLGDYIIETGKLLVRQIFHQINWENKPIVVIGETI